MVVATEIGLASPLGSNAHIACAAARAGVTRPTELKCLNFSDHQMFGAQTIDEFPPVVGHVAAGVTSGAIGKARTMQLGQMALSDLLQRRQLRPDELPRTKVLVNFSDDFFIQEYRKAGIDDTPEPYEEDIEGKRQSIERIFERNRLRLANPTTIHLGGRAGITELVERAVNEIKSGAADRCIVGAIDTAVEPEFLLATAEMNLLKTNDNPCGFIPGEAAAFVLLEREAAKKGDSVSLRHFKYEDDEWTPASEEPPNGIVLASVVQAALSEADQSGEQIGLVVGDLNGVEARAHDWGNAVVRLQRKWPIGDLPLWLPALSFGETGAVTGLLAIAKIMRGYARGYIPNCSALVWLGSDTGRRSVFIVRSDNSGD